LLTEYSACKIVNRRIDNQITECDDEVIFQPMSSDGYPHLSYILESPQQYTGWRDFRRDVEAVAQCGYQGIELQMITPDDLSDADFTRLLDDCGLRLVGIQTGSAYLENGTCLGSPDAAVRQAAMDLLERYIDCVAPFQSVIVFGLLQGSRRDEPDRQRALERILTHLSKLADYACAAGVIMAMEPVNRYECSVFHNTVADVLSSVESVSSPSLRGMVDTFHVNIEESGQQQAIYAAAPVLSHVHLSDTNRGLLGTGHLDFGSVFSALHDVNYAGFVSVGIYRDAPSVAERVRHASQQLQSIRSANGRS
jgi:sugar phosphate isomerase/epimerase